MPITTLRSTSLKPGQPLTSLNISGCRLGPMGLTAADGPVTFEQWMQVGAFLEHLTHALHWWIGDWVLLGETCFGERAAQAMTATGWQYGTISQLAWVSKNVPLERRNPELSFSHHREVADLPDAETQVAWLTRAQTEGWPTHRLREELRAAKRLEQNLPPEPLWLLVACDTADDRDRLADRMQLEGRATKRPEGRKL